MTVDRTYLLATPSMSAETTYVGMTRHRVAATLFYGRDQFDGRGGLAQALSRPEHKTFSAAYEKDALKRLADQGQPVADRPRTLGQRLGARAMAHETPRAKLAREIAQSVAKTEAAMAARPIGDQVQYYDGTMEAIASRRQEKAFRVMEHAEVRMRRRYQTLNALPGGRPAEPTGFLAGLRRPAYRSQLAEWQQQYDQVHQLARQAEKTLSAVAKVAIQRSARQLAETVLQKRLPKLTERVLAFKAEQERERAEQARERVREQQRQRELDRSLGKSKGRGLSR